MAPAYSCLRCGYATDIVGNYNKHINKSSKCKPKEIEECLLCAKQCKVGGSTLRKHVCLADKSLDGFEMQHSLFSAVCLELKSMPDNDFQQLGPACHQPEDMALAAWPGWRYCHPKSCPKMCQPCLAESKSAFNTAVCAVKKMYTCWWDQWGSLSLLRQVNTWYDILFKLS